MSFLDHTHRSKSRIRPDFFPAFYFQHDDYIRDKKWLFKAGTRIFFGNPRVSFESMILDFFVARRMGGFEYGFWKAAKLVLRGFGTVSAKLLYGRSLGLEVGIGDAILLFGSNHPAQRLIKAYCEERGVKLVMVEHGSLTGTIHFSPESVTHGLYPMRFPRRFRSSRISEQDYLLAKRFLDEVAKGEVDQKPQSVDQPLLQRLRANRGKIVFLPGLGNVGGGLYPRLSSVSKQVSPIFRTNWHLLETVLKVSKRHGWTVVYKPHPNEVGGEGKISRDETLVMSEECSIPELVKACDCIVCLGTKVSQTALAMGKPVVLVGSYSLLGMGCCYDVREKGDLECQMKKALEIGFTDRQRKVYIEYVAREFKYCLFQYKTFTEGRYGRSQVLLAELLKSYFEGYGETVEDRYGDSLIFAKGE